MTRERTIRARLREDCARNLRVDYLLAEPLHEHDVERLGLGTPAIRRFSDLVPGARDLAELRAWDGRLRIVGVIGEACLTVTYGLPNAPAESPDLVRFEDLLADAGFGRVDSARGFASAPRSCQAGAVEINA